MTLDSLLSLCCIFARVYCAVTSEEACKRTSARSMIQVDAAPSSTRFPLSSSELQHVTSKTSPNSTRLRKCFTFGFSLLCINQTVCCEHQAKETRTDETNLDEHPKGE